MIVQNRISPVVLKAATDLLSPFVPELSPRALVDALKSHNSAIAPSASFAKPLSRKEAACLLGVSLPTINRLLNRGDLKRIRVTPGVVRIDAASVHTLLNGNDSDIEA